MELNNHQFLKPLVLPAALKQFEYQATNRLLDYLLHQRNMEIQAQHKKKGVKKTPAKMLPSTLSKHCMCSYCKHFCCNNHAKQN